MVDDACCHYLVLLYLNACVYLALLWRYGASNIYLLGSRNVIVYVTIRLTWVYFLWVVHSDHASI